MSDVDQRITVWKEYKPDLDAYEYSLRVESKMLIEARAFVPDKYIAAYLTNLLRELVNISKLDELVEEKTFTKTHIIRV